MGASRGRGRPRQWIDIVTEWSGRSVQELRIAAIEREQVMAASPGMRPHYNPEDEVATDASLCQMMMMMAC